MSRTSSRWRSRRASPRRSTGDRPPASTTPRAWAIVEATRAGSRTAARATNDGPVGEVRRPARRRRWRARRVLPTPPGPVSVTSRTPSSPQQAAHRRHLASRPIRGDSGAGSPDGWRPRWAAAAAFRHRGRQGRALVVGQPEGGGQGADRRRVGMAVLAPLQRADGVRRSAPPARPVPPGSVPRRRGRAAAARRRRARLVAAVPVVRPSPAPHRLRAPWYPSSRRAPTQVGGEVGEKTWWCRGSPGSMLVSSAAEGRGPSPPGWHRAGKEYPMTTSTRRIRLSPHRPRRLGAGGLGLALAATARQASAQDAATDMASHPSSVVLAGDQRPPRPDRHDLSPSSMRKAPTSKGDRGRPGPGGSGCGRATGCAHRRPDDLLPGHQPDPTGYAAGDEHQAAIESRWTKRETRRPRRTPPS